LAIAGAAAAMTAAMTAAAAAQDSDPYVWLEEINSPRALEWVKTENARTLADFQADPRYQTFYRRALEVLEAQDRIPLVVFRRGELYNFWQDAAHLKGIVRRTSEASYRTASPAWETVLDIDALAKAEGKSWVYQGMQCLPPDEQRCLVELSEGGRDASVLREFDLGTRTFVGDGFSLPEGKQYAAWVDADTLLVARDWGPGTMTESGYPLVVKRLKRGQPLAQAQELYRGQKSDVGAFPAVLRDSSGQAHAELAIRYISTFEQEVAVLGGASKVTLDLPRRSQLVGVVDGRVVMSLQEPWRTNGQSFPVDALVSYDLAEWKRAPDKARPSLVWAPADRQTLVSSAISKGQLLLVLLDNVRGRATAMNFANGAWSTTPIALPANATVDLISADERSDQAMFQVADFLNPSSLYHYDGATGSVERIKTTPARFDASKSAVSQYEAVAKDGTRIPYFVVHPKGMKLDGSTPTLLNGYGGFQTPQLPYYSAALGRLWLEQGNAFVVANIRGGGEFGPSWHQTAIRETKQRTWDDFITVAEDVVRRGISSPRRLGVVGGSQGGLLVGTAITQRPELFNAAIVQVPLFDMLRYHLIGAGSSWTGEYGDPRVPAERAWLEAYSPYQKLVRGKQFPTPFYITSTADDRVTPVHGRKAAARMKEIGAPYFYFENLEGGHAAAANNPEKARNVALEYIYATRRLAD
jgi:prolyl oligopeptidase